MPIAPTSTYFSLEFLLIESVITLFGIIQLQFKYKLVTEAEPANKPVPREVTLLGIVSDVIGRPTKALLPTVVTLFGKTVKEQAVACYFIRMQE